MGKMQRNKGASFERDVCKIFSADLRPGGPEFKRNIGQARDGGNDIDVGPLVIEVKIRKTLGTVYGWLQQAIVAATERSWAMTTGPASQALRSSAVPPAESTHVPIVVARQDGDCSPIVILRLSDFLTLTREKLIASL